MAISLRIPREKEKLIEKYAKKKGITKTAVILEALDSKLGLSKDRKQQIKDLAGFLTHEEAEELRNSLRVFDQIHNGDWD